ncbi:MAG: GNAT family N-acetyltransferase, partial [Longimicrobiales bacterium]|nr:GNAT family N-acetyltransferase [Longimicrobiales bacterium]
RPLTPDDWPDVRRIYQEGIASGDATFETEAPTWEAWDGARRPDGRIVAENDDSVVGFAALSPVSKRPVYAGVAEVMVYVAASARGRGVGTRLLHALVEASEAAGVWTLTAGIFPENEASIRAHHRVGFRTVGRHHRIGRFHDGRWRDTVLLERRSEVVGVD